jgi:uncharacterized membrane protein YjjB (DUF3815 family)
MFSQPWFWMYVFSISLAKANVYSTKHYEDNALIHYENIVLYLALIVFVILTSILSEHWWWGLVMALCGWMMQFILANIRNMIRMSSAMYGSPAGNVLVRSIEMLAAPILAILAYLFFFFM